MRIINIFFVLIILISCKKEDTETLGPPIISRFYNEADTAGATLTICGENFSKYPSKNIVGFQGIETEAFYVEKNLIKVIVPELARSGTISLTVYSQKTISNDTFTVVTGRFKKVKSIPVGRSYGVAFAIGSKGYVTTGTGTEYLNDLWEYNPASDEWNKKSDFIGGRRRQAFSFVINGKAYLGAGTNMSTIEPVNDFYEYDSSDDTWTKKSNIPISTFYSDNIVGLAINNKGYIITGAYTTGLVFEYDPLTDEWKRKADFPGSPRDASSGFVINNKGYFGIGWSGGGQHLYDFWEYDPANDLWTRKADLPKLLGYYAVGFSLNNRGYFANGNYNSFFVWEYNPVDDTWNRKLNYPGESNGYAAVLVINNKAYIIGGAAINKSSDENWRFSP